MKLTVRGRAGSLAWSLAQQIPAILVARHDLPGAQHDDVGIGQEIERRRRRLARDQHQCAGLGDRREARGQRHRIARLGFAAADLQQRPLGPGQRVERLGIGRHRELGGQVFGGEIARHLAPARRRPTATRVTVVCTAFGHRNKEVDPRRRIERCGARRDQVAAVRGDPRR
jgi:hypothetical protein